MLHPVPRSLLIQGFALALLAGCGGSGSDRYADAVAAADAKEAEARAAAAVSPCTTVAQCGVLKFQSPASGCSNWSYKPYSLVSPTAPAASAAAGEQNALARQAQSLGPGSNIACAAVVPQEPVLSCVANTCSGA